MVCLILHAEQKSRGIQSNKFIKARDTHVPVMAVDQVTTYFSILEEVIVAKLMHYKLDKLENQNAHSGAHYSTSVENNGLALDLREPCI